MGCWRHVRRRDCRRHYRAGVLMAASAPHPPTNTVSQVPANHYPLFKGATRVATVKGGVPTRAFVGLVFLTVVVAMFIRIWGWAVFPILYPIVAIISRNDDRAFWILELWWKTKFTPPASLVPAVRDPTAMKDSRSVAPPRHEPAVSDYVPFSHHVTPTVIATRNWEYVSVWRVDGRTFEGYPEADKCRWVDELNNLFRGLPAGMGLWTHLIRRKVQEYPQSEYPDTFSQNHDAAYRATFDGKPPMINELYLTTIARASIDPALRLLSRFEKRTARDVMIWQERAIEQLDDVNRKLGGALKRYRAEQLQINSSGCS
ncbi:hypothetical protein G6F65_017070 [Rhizopus arrhizus]|nr:hypothetical protein G6F65_017070 [Rhizopus arrhizus]